MESLQQFRFSNDLDGDLRQLENRDQLAVAASRMDILNNRFLSHLLYCFDYPNVTHDYSLKMLMQKKYPLMHELNRFIQHAFANDLIVK